MLSILVDRKLGKIFLYHRRGLFSLYRKSYLIINYFTTII